MNVTVEAGCVRGMMFKCIEACVEGMLMLVCASRVLIVYWVCV
jgi:hypothetical protein